jgi:hypothetical protein
MKIINLELNSSVLRGSKQDAYNCLKESLHILKLSHRLVISLKSWDSSSNIDEEVYTSSQLINCEELLPYLNTPGIDLFKLAGLSKVPVLYDRLVRFQFFRDKLVPILDSVTLAYITLSAEERDIIKKYTVEILKQLSFFIFFEFNFDAMSLSVQEERELEINEVVLDYCGQSGISKDKLLLFMTEIYMQYRPVIPSFDFSDEEKDMFYYRAGLCAYSIIENMDDLDPQIVRQIIDGTVSPEEVVRKILSQNEVKELDVF